MAKERKSLTEAAGKAMKAAFSLDKFKENKGLGGNVKFKPQDWIPFSPALQEASIYSWMSYGSYHDSSW
jgi:hypothetical protein